MPRERMSTRERWLTVLNHGIPDKVPVFYRATAEFTGKLMAYLGCNGPAELHRRLHVDPIVSVGGRYVGPDLPSDQDEYGITYFDFPYDGGTYREAIGFPLAGFQSVDEIKKHYRFPSADWWDFSPLSKMQNLENQFVTCTLSEPFLVYCRLRGLEQAYLDLVLNPDIVHYCLDQLFALAYEKGSRLFAAIPGKLDMAMVAEDLGSQTSLLMSPQSMQEFLFPRMKRMMDLAHQAGAKVITHSDGAIRPVLPDLIEMGMEVLDPVQWRCEGMDRAQLKREFGQQVVFHGAMDNQYTLAYGSLDDVRQEVRDNIRILGAGGGFILGPCHAIQVVSPPENIVAMYDTAYEEGWY